jgi:opacity protein-like surface antigen
VLLGYGATGAGAQLQGVAGATGHKEHKVYKDYLVTGASGSSIPSGLDMQIQYNDNGVLGADADFVWNKVTNDLILTGIDAGIILGNNN